MERNFQTKLDIEKYSKYDGKILFIPVVTYITFNNQNQNFNEYFKQIEEYKRNVKIADELNPLENGDIYFMLLVKMTLDKCRFIIIINDGENLYNINLGEFEKEKITDEVINHIFKEKVFYVTYYTDTFIKYRFLFNDIYFAISHIKFLMYIFTDLIL